MAAMSRRPLILVTAVVAVVAVAALLIVPRLGGASAEGTDLRLEQQPRKGPADAPVEVVVFEDFLCPHCGTFAESVAPRIERTFVEDGDVAYYVMNFVVIGPESERIAQVGECVLEQSNDAYWAFETAAYRSQQGLDEARAIELALEYAGGLDEERLRSCVDEDRQLEAVRADGATAQELGLRGTPSVLVDGEQVDPSFGAISDAIETALADTP
jgi:protein-disulfide isomerase